MRTRRPPAAIRTRLLRVVAATTATAVAALIVTFNVALQGVLDDQATSAAESRAVGVMSTLETAGGHVRAGEAPDGATVDARVWVLDGATVIESPQPPTPALDARARSVARLAPKVATEAGYRLVAVPVGVGRSPLGSVVAAVSLAPYASTERVVLVASILLGGALLGAVAVITRWTLVRALRPVQEMTELAAAWSERDPDRRFAQGVPRDELTRLAGTLDALLARLAASLRREERLSAELAHELRTPLARIVAECDLAVRTDTPHDDRDEALAAIARSAEEMRRTIDVLVSAARHGAGHQRGVADVSAVLSKLQQRASIAASRRGVEVSASSPAGLQVSLDDPLVERIIEPVLENAVRHAVRLVTLTAAPSGHSVVVVIEDDGRGVEAADRERIFEPGVRGVTATGDGAGLGLSLASRLASEVGGRIELTRADGVTRFSISLPR